jgi:uncharacterized protein
MLLLKRASIAAVVFAPLAIALPVNADTNPEALKVARQILDVTDASDRANQALMATMKSLSGIIEAANPGKAKEIDELLNGLLAPEFHKDLGELLDVTSRTYADNFTADELRQILAFYQSDVGKKLIERQPAIIQKQSQIGQARGLAVYASIREKLLKALREKGLQTPPNI